MNLMLAVRQGLTAVDAILRTCARAEGLERSEALVLGMVQVRPRSAGDLAWCTGQPRQQAQRCLRALQARRLVEPVAFLRGKVVAWGLTAEGSSLWARLYARLAAYERVVNERVSRGWSRPCESTPR